MDTRVRGKLTLRLERISKREIDPADRVDPQDVEIDGVEGQPGAYKSPNCSKCPSKCCIHKEVGSGILLSLKDVAQLIDAGLGDLIVGQFTFRRSRNGTMEIDKMPRLAKREGNCVFYDTTLGLCNAYGVRPTICRRFPYEVHYRPGSGKPFARFIPWAPCPTTTSPKHEESVRQMVRDSIDDENLSYEDVMLLPDFIEELRRLGFAQVLPPAPARRAGNRNGSAASKSKASTERKKTKTSKNENNGSRRRKHATI